MTSRLLSGFVAVALTHLPELDSDFHYDDGHPLLRNSHIRSLGNITSFFIDPNTFSENSEYAMCRPLVVLSYAVNHSLGGYDATSYHVLNQILHCCVTWAVLVLSGLLGLQRREASLSTPSPSNRADQLRQQSLGAACGLVLRPDDRRVH